MDPAGPAADAIDRLWWVMLAGSGAILALVLTLMALAFRRPRRSASIRAWIIGLGLIFPGIVLAALLAYGLVVGESLLPKDDPRPVRVGAHGTRYAWTFTHPSRDGGVIPTRGSLHIPAGRPVDVALTSGDVIHAFWVPRLAGKVDAIPGHENFLRLEASEPGVYPGVCAEYCGVGHTGHVFTVIAHDAQGWTEFQREDGR